MKTLVVFYTRTGTTKNMAEILAKKLKADIDEIVDHTNRKGALGWIMGGHDVVRKLLTKITYSQDPSKYDLVVVGTPIWAWSATPAVRTYLTENKNKIKKVAFFTTSISDSPDKTVLFMEELLGKKSLGFTGWTKVEIDQGEAEKKLNSFVKMLS